MPGTDSRRARSPSLATIALTAASLAPVTVLSAVTRIWLLTGSSPNEVPGVLREALSAESAAARAAPLRST
ncbi:hypothetical protein Asp14428_68110 [Actinoplanes sp. NBRC 14428]|nr:hypothetical protein Asp14428_68110 [Actinoplanes sp. NBRC 14428]